MGMETIALLLSFGALVVLAVLIGRVFLTLLKIGLVALFLYAVYSVVQSPNLCAPGGLVRQLGPWATKTFCQPPRLPDKIEL